MSGRGILKYFHPITHKMYTPEDKDPPQVKELPNYLGHIQCISKVIPPPPHRHRDQLPALTLT